MKPFEFVLVIISVIVGLAMTEFAIGVTFMIQNHRTAIFYWPHIVIGLFGLVSCLNYWGTVYKLRRVPNWTIIHVGIVFMSGLLFFIMTKICFPSSDNFDLNYEKYFHENIRVILLLMILFVISISLEALVVRRVRQIKKFAVNILFILVSGSGLLTHNKTYISALTVVLLVIQIIFILRAKTLIADKEN